MKSNYVNRRYGWRPDVPDHRDYRFKTIQRFSSLPKSIPCLTAEMAVEDQGDLGSCTAHASTAMVEYTLGMSDLSRLMAYYNARKLENTVRSDDGATLRSSIKGLLKTGTCLESLWPYNVSKFKTKPSAKAFTGAKAVVEQVSAAQLVYSRVTTLLELLTALANSQPVTFGFAVPARIEKLPKSGILSLPSSSEAMLGGHAVLAVGYDKSNETVLVRNSWGSDWALDGYFKMKWAWFTDSRMLVDDMWTLGPK